MECHLGASTLVLVFCCRHFAHLLAALPASYIVHCAVCIAHCALHVFVFGSYEFSFFLLLSLVACLPCQPPNPTWRPGNNNEQRTHQLWTTGHMTVVAVNTLSLSLLDDASQGLLHCALLQHKHIDRLTERKIDTHQQMQTNTHTHMAFSPKVCHGNSVHAVKWIVEPGALENVALGVICRHCGEHWVDRGCVRCSEVHEACKRVAAKKWHLLARLPDPKRRRRHCSSTLHGIKRNKGRHHCCANKRCGCEPQLVQRAKRPAQHTCQTQHRNQEKRKKRRRKTTKRVLVRFFFFFGACVGSAHFPFLEIDWMLQPNQQTKQLLGGKKEVWGGDESGDFGSFN